MASLGSSIRSAARATSSAYRRVPTRWRLAGGSAALTFTILCGFAIIVGFLTTRQIGIQFNDAVRESADYVAKHSGVAFDVESNRVVCGRLQSMASADAAKVRAYIYDGQTYQPTGCAFGGTDPERPLFDARGEAEQHGYRWESRQITVPVLPGRVQQFSGLIVYARPLSATKATVSKVRVFLVFGVVGGAALALAAGLLVARRAMDPIAQLTATAREIARTRDPSRHLPVPEADDEVRELARTLDAMLQALDASQHETEALLARQRQFVADASHELRTPLTSVLANLELLEETLQGDQRDAAASALRSSRRMRRLVADLLLLARADARRVVPHGPTDLARVLLDVAAELEPIAARAEHHLTVEADGEALVSGARDELHRLALNLIENAVNHTPGGTHVHAALRQEPGEVLLVVEDDGPGIPAAIRERLFERFVRGGGESGGGSGLGLAIVRAVARSHGGSVQVENRPSGGARFVVRLPALERTAADRAPAGV